MAALVAVSLYYIIPPSVKTRLGLDLQGGLEVVYTARTADGKAPTQAQLDQTVGILDRRVNGLGVTESQIQTQGADQIAIALPGITDAEQALSVIGKTAQLEFFKDDAESRPVGPVESKEAALKQLRDQGVSKAEIEQLRQEGTSDGPLPRREPGGRRQRHPRAVVRVRAAAGDDRRGRQERPRRLRQHDRQAQRAHRLHERGQQAVPGHHPGAVPHRPPQEHPADLRHRARQRHGVGPDDRLHRPHAARRHQRRRGDQRRQHDRPGVQGPGVRAQHRRAARSSSRPPTSSRSPRPWARTPWTRPSSPASPASSWSSSTCSCSTGSSGSSPTSRSSSTASCSGGCSTSSRSR